MPLDPRSDGEIGEELQGKLSDVVNKKYKNEAAKKKKVLDSKLKKIEKKWNKYADDARKLGINTTVFCDETCSHECFLQADQATYDVLTKCLIGKCQCFKPKLPNVDKKISFDALITLKKIITEEEEDSLKVVDTYGKIADKYEAEVESLKNTANSIDEVIEETLKTVNAKKQHQEAQIVDTKNSIKNPESITSALPANPSTLDKAISSTAKALKKELETASVTLETPPATADPAKSDSEILDPASTEKPSCNLTCFNECLNLKKYIPFPVIQQCIDLRCHCSLKGLTDNAESFIALTSNEVIVKKMEESMQEHSSVLKVFLVFIIVSLITLAAAYLVFKYTEERGKRRAYNSYGVNNDQAYEKLA
uniref:Uncharacterized protein n=1 Tax=Euplotes crassus TaxID=5936 RepID=A0A7S3KEM5_EUPCR|mmetsp:Transcript_21824/g.21556  ORF Transcript_21824/g.21556 Transcript_21824/m.21556 type:complete len:366 (+) Transcript_21824:469-1566(+)